MARVWLLDTNSTCFRKDMEISPLSFIKWMFISGFFASFMIEKFKLIIFLIYQKNLFVSQYYDITNFDISWMPWTSLILFEDHHILRALLNAWHFNPREEITIFDGKELVNSEIGIRLASLDPVLKLLLENLSLPLCFHAVKIIGIKFAKEILMCWEKTNK